MDAADGNSDWQFVYIVHKESHQPDVFKIGYTKGTPSKRLSQLNKETGSLYSFKGKYIIRTPEGRKTEKRIHEHLKLYRIRKDREFFKIDEDELRSKIKELEYELECFEEVEIPPKQINKKCRKPRKPRIPKILRKIEPKFIVLYDYWNNFELKYNKQGYIYRIIECNGVKCIKYEKVNNDIGAFEQMGFYLHSKDDGKLKETLFKIKTDINYYKRIIDRVRKEHENIVETLTLEVINIDTKQLLDYMKKTKGNLSNVQKEYKWDDDGSVGGSEPSHS